jgi:hypothetical protein
MGEKVTSTLVSGPSPIKGNVGVSPRERVLCLQVPLIALLSRLDRLEGRKVTIPFEMNKVPSVESFMPSRRYISCRLEHAEQTRNALP